MNVPPDRDALASDPTNLRLVVLLAKRVHGKLPSSFDLDDLIAVGNMALLKAAGRYDPGAHGGAPFSAFARQAIRGAIIESVRRNKYIENTRASIDDPGKPSVHAISISPAGGDLKFETEAARAVAGMATQPAIEISIDRARLVRRVSQSIARLPAEQRNLIEIWYGSDEPSPREVARRIGRLSKRRILSPAGANKLHAIAIATLRRRLNLPVEIDLPKAA